LLRFAFAEFSPRRPTLLWRQLDGSDVLRHCSGCVWMDQWYKLSIF
jgi:hypothetical protein